MVCIFLQFLSSVQLNRPMFHTLSKLKQKSLENTDLKKQTDTLDKSPKPNQQDKNIWARQTDV